MSRGRPARPDTNRGGRNRDAPIGTARAARGSCGGMRVADWGSMGRMTHRVSRSAAALAACSALCAPHAVHARRHVTSDPLPADQIQQLVADQDRLVARRDGEVLIFASDGSRLGRCGARAAPPPRAPRAWAGAPEAPELLRDAGLPDDDSTWLAEEVLEDE